MKNTKSKDITIKVNFDGHKAIEKIKKLHESGLNKDELFDFIKQNMIITVENKDDSVISLEADLEGFSTDLMKQMEERM